jgi:hypothetical protein
MGCYCGHTKRRRSPSFNLVANGMHHVDLRAGQEPKATWVEPALEAEVAYSTMAENGLLRESRVQGRWNPLMPLAFNTG